MDEDTTDDAGADEVAAQLRRYADAAEAAVPHDLEVQHRASTRWRPLAAAAVVLAIVAGGAFTWRSLDDDRTAITLEGTVTVPDPAPDLEDTCPAPRADGPRVDDLRVMLPSVATTTEDTVTGDGGEVESILLEIGDGGTELRVAALDAADLAEMFPGGPSASFETCDPFAAAPRRTEVPGTWTVGQDRRLHAELALTDGADRAWLVTASTPLDDRDPTSEQPGSARADLRRVIAGTSWPAPVDAPRRDDVCTNEPVATVGDHQLLAVPEGYTLGETQEMETGAVDMGGERWTRLGLPGPDGAQITVVSIGTSNFDEALESNAVGVEPGSLTIRRCRTSPVGQGTPAGTEELIEIRRSGDRLVVGAQEWEYGGWMVVGSGGATEEDVIAVAEAFRS